MSLKVNNVVLMNTISEFLYLPHGTTSERPSDANARVGMIRYNTTLDVVELYSNGAWNSLPAFTSSGAISPGTKTIYSWGADSYGETFRTAGTTALSPLITNQTFNFRKLVSSKVTNNTLIINYDGTLWGVGENRNGELGLGDTAPRLSVTKIGNDSWLDISCFNNHVVGIKSDGTLWAWGDNTYGQLGTNDTTARLSPTQVGTLTDWVSVVCGDQYTLGIRSSPTGSTTVWATGKNNSGQLGTGNTTSPIKTMTQSSVSVAMRQVFCGTASSYGISTAGDLYSWGDNAYGQLGQNNTTNLSSPTKITTFTGIQSASISVGSSHVLVATIDGFLYSWGNNDVGQLGKGTTGGTQLSPLRIDTNTDWLLVSAGYKHSLGLRGSNNGNLWVWGDNSSGQLGIGNTSSKSVPEQAASGIVWGFIVPGFDNSIGITYDLANFGGKTFTASTTWPVPDGVTSICIAAIGGGGGGSRGSTASGGGGGGVVYANNIPVKKDDQIVITVGSGGAGSSVSGQPGTNGGGSSVSVPVNNIITKILEAFGGNAGSNYTTAGAGGSFYINPTFSTNYGGYNGGSGVNASGGVPAQAGGGVKYIGAGGGGASAGTVSTGNNGGAGGGTSGTSGGLGYSLYTGGGGGGGQLGAGLKGENGGPGASDVSTIGGLGGNLGGGGGGSGRTYSKTPGTGDGGNGAVRIIWGIGRSFPAALTEKLGSEI